MKTIYIIGAPGSGKTSLATSFKLTWGRSTEIAKPFAHEMFYFGARFNVSLGKNNPPFSGTDTLSNTVINLVTKVYPSWKAMGQVETILGEGDRLATDSMMNLAKEHSDLFLFYLDTPEELANERRTKRAEAHKLKLQNPSWVKGRKTKHERLAERFGAFQLDGTHETAELVAQIHTKIGEA
jgi:hypothetical protein